MYMCIVSNTYCIGMVRIEYVYRMAADSIVPALLLIIYYNQNYLWAEVDSSFQFIHWHSQRNFYFYFIDQNAQIINIVHCIHLIYLG